MLTNDYSEEYYARLYEKAVRLAKEGIEIWRGVPKYEDFYEASNLGRVRSLDRILISRYGKKRRWKGKMLAGFGHEDGYTYISIGRNVCDKRPILRHHVILMTFFGPKPDGLECRHLDGDPSNNRIDNLKYGTRAENVQDAIRHGTFHTECKNNGSGITHEQRVEMGRKGCAVRWGKRTG